jgi:hypothetical protein
MIVSSRPLRRAAVAGSIVLFAACASAPEIIDGECQDMFGADVCTWGVMNGDDVVEFGATIPMASIDGAPADAPMEFPPPLIAAVRLPEEIRAATGFDHLGINWESMGHPPETWLTPHFDFHFYTLTPDEMAAVDCTNLEKPAAVPDGYMLPDMDIPGIGMLIGLCVPGMGMHSARETEMDDTELFDAAMIMGYYDQSFMSVEPMIARATFEAQQSFSLDIPAVPDPGRATMVPVSFEAEYDAEAQAYRFVFRVSGEQ